ncbi:hypothetical protein LEM8419_02211 [Neolewinella maritima]|uniref:Metal-dependent HD superfamily phosphohydrolase n=1 Tax=Neolewinella maritima TaxID=1383882 RepID=A0ABM9B1T1_9BACT|nr:hypothetical protein [Neolewinella maritima]CAH1001310.1 hypothetical protein LEM8419_02211 [Neolewinella maritima]
MSIDTYVQSLQQLLPSVPISWKNIRRAYTGRAYHNLDHLDEMLLHLARHRAAVDGPLIEDEAIFAMALVYHDLVYKPTRSDNEARSAQAAQTLLQEGQLVPDRIAQCTALIMATKAHLPPAGDKDAALLIDLDLAVLARDAAGYTAYVAAIREEFWMVPGFVFRKGRSKALTAFLDREHIYHTPFGRETYEARARENLWRELRDL